MSERGKYYTHAGDFYWCEVDGLWHPSHFGKAKDWHISLVQGFFKPNRSGVSDFVSIDSILEAFPLHANQIGGKGSDLFTRGLLARNFMFNDKEAVIKDSRHNRITHRRSVGLVARSAVNPYIRKDIHAAIVSQPCSVAGTRTRIECDHREGRKTSVERYKTENQVIEDFQPLCAVMNLVKREACARCKITDNRFDARTLGYTIGWASGGKKYRGSCDGCFWHDPRGFRAQLTRRVK